MKLYREKITFIKMCQVKNYTSIYTIVIKCISEMTRYNHFNKNIIHFIINGMTKKSEK